MHTHSLTSNGPLQSPTPAPTPVPQPVYEYPSGYSGLDIIYSATVDKIIVTGQGYGNGIYRLAVSSALAQEYMLRYIFDKNVRHDQNWISVAAYSTISGAYVGLITTKYGNNVLYAGEWIQVQLPNAINVAYYELAPMFFNGVDVSSRSPKDFVLLGSNTGDSWVLIDNHTSVTGWSTSGTNKRFTVSAVVGEYSYYRLCIGRIQGASVYANVTALSEWKLFSTRAPLQVIPIL
jgi:hypothetical protein